MVTRLVRRRERGTEFVDDRLLFRDQAKEFQTVHEPVPVSHNRANRQRFVGVGQLKPQCEDIPWLRVAGENGSHACVRDIATSPLRFEVTSLVQRSGG